MEHRRVASLLPCILALIVAVFAAPIAAASPVAASPVAAVPVQQGSSLSAVAVPLAGKCVSKAKNKKPCAKKATGGKKHKPSGIKVVRRGNWLRACLTPTVKRGGGAAFALDNDKGWTAIDNKDIVWRSGKLTQSQILGWVITAGPCSWAHLTNQAVGKRLVVVAPWSYYRWDLPFDLVTQTRTPGYRGTVRTSYRTMKPFDLAVDTPCPPNDRWYPVGGACSTMGGGVG